ncbi:MAG: hypothetical protein RJR34_08210 [Candidatus Methanoculleus thermohydrogenotrophicum]|nr:hypothetical protein [Candidatus Methanoculleus thermohydrogenotrophicum]
MGEEIQLVGKVFSREEDADALASYLDGQIEEIRKRTADVPEDEKPRMMQPDLSPRARQGGGDTIESYFIEEIANTKNAYEGTGAFVVISTEQILRARPGRDRPPDRPRTTTRQANSIPLPTTRICRNSRP